MMERFILGALGVTLGLLLTRIFDQHQINKLKEELTEMEAEHNEVLNANTKLVNENKQLKEQLRHMIPIPPSSSNIPKFDD